jgi:hypothetical protein
MSETDLGEWLMALGPGERTFPRKVVAGLILVCTFPTDPNFVGLAWVCKGKDEFYCNAKILAKHFKVEPNSVAHNFRDHGFRKRSSQGRDGIPIPDKMIDRRAWKVRWHPALKYKCDQSTATLIRYRKRPRDDRPAMATPLAIPPEMALGCLSRCIGPPVGPVAMANAPDTSDRPSTALEMAIRAVGASCFGAASPTDSSLPIAPTAEKAGLLVFLSLSRPASPSASAWAPGCELSDQSAEPRATDEPESRWD